MGAPRASVSHLQEELPVGQLVVVLDVAEVGHALSTGQTSALVSCTDVHYSSPKGREGAV